MLSVPGPGFRFHGYWVTHTGESVGLRRCLPGWGKKLLWAVRGLRLITKKLTVDPLGKGSDTFVCQASLTMSFVLLVAYGSLNAVSHAFDCQTLSMIFVSLWTDHRGTTLN